jgi:hypothetical protein
MRTGDTALKRANLGPVRKFNDILKAEDVDPKSVPLVRHEDAGKGASRIYATNCP